MFDLEQALDRTARILRTKKCDPPWVWGSALIKHLEIPIGDPDKEYNITRKALASLLHSFANERLGVPRIADIIENRNKGD